MVWALRYLCDEKRHLICVPYSIEGLHTMADDLKINRNWFHYGKFPHYDIPKRRIDEIQAKCETVSSKEIVTIIKESLYGENSGHWWDPRDWEDVNH